MSYHYLKQAEARTKPGQLAWGFFVDHRLAAWRGARCAGSVGLGGSESADVVGHSRCAGKRRAGGLGAAGFLLARPTGRRPPSAGPEGLQGGCSWLAALPGVCWFVSLSCGLLIRVGRPLIGSERPRIGTCLVVLRFVDSAVHGAIKVVHNRQFP